MSFQRFWYPCEHPERPIDIWTQWHTKDFGGPCQACRISAHAWVMRLYGPDTAAELGLGRPPDA